MSNFFIYGLFFTDKKLFIWRIILTALLFSKSKPLFLPSRLSVDAFVRSSVHPCPAPALRLPCACPAPALRLPCACQSNNGTMKTGTNKQKAVTTAAAGYARQLKILKNFGKSYTVHGVVVINPERAMCMLDDALVADFF